MIIPTNLVCVLLSGTTVAMWSVTINLDPRFFGPYNNIMDPPCILSTIAKIQKGQRLGSGYEWLAGLVSRVCIATRVSLHVLQGGGGPNISGIQISRDRSPSVCNFFKQFMKGQAKHF